ncbi:MAG: hypothetical protein AB2A00_03625 [Myxococcota bacterium]
MNRRDDPKDTLPETVAALQMELDREGVSSHKLLHGAMTLAAMGYPAAAREYAARALIAARREGDEESREMAAAMLLTARMERGVA